MRHSDEILAIIPARGDRRVSPEKLASHRRQAVVGVYRRARARTAALDITRIVVSTDDREIGAVAEDWGAEVIPRPPELSGDEASSGVGADSCPGLPPSLGGLRTGARGLPAGDLAVATAERHPFGHRDTPSRGADSLFSAGPVHGFRLSAREERATLVVQLRLSEPASETGRSGGPDRKRIDLCLQDGSASRDRKSPGREDCNLPHGPARLVAGR